MRHRFVLLTLFGLFALPGCIAVAWAAEGGSSARIVRPIDESETVALPGNVHPLARSSASDGLAQPALAMRHMILLLKPDAAQQAALDRLLADQADPKSPLFHRFLSSQQFADRFGVSDADLAQITSWLTSHGFVIDEVPAGHRTIVFSGTAAEVALAFSTQIREFTVNGQRHHANANDPRIPAALAGVVRGIVSLHDFHHRAALARAQRLPEAGAADPQYNAGGAHYLSPADYSAIYGLGPVYKSQIDGTGQSIAVVARSNIALPDVETFRSKYGLQANDPAVILADGIDPGLTDDETEAELDVQWAGAIAPKASVKLVVASSTVTADGVDLAAQYVVNQNLASVVSVSFGECEASLGSSGLAFYEQLWQQAAAQGMSVFVSAGDAGAAGCSHGGDDAGAARGVNGLCTSPYSVCVGGTEFNEGDNPGQYWLAGNNDFLGSAQSYIPETVWNESGSNHGTGLWAGGGGASSYFSKPAWQTGLGVPQDGHRDVPDVSLSAASHDGYLVEAQGRTWVVAGTSAAAPSLAGMMALVDQKTAAPQGNPNPRLYALAAIQNAGGAAVFHDVTTGSNSVPGVNGFSAAAGYDLASGLGSVDAALLVSHWSDRVRALNAGALTVSASPATVSAGTGRTAAISVQTSVTGNFSSAVVLSVSGLPSGVSSSFAPLKVAAPGGGTATLTLSVGSHVAAGTYTLTVTAQGGSLSSTATVTLVVPAATFSLSAVPSSLSVITGSLAQTTVNIMSDTGFNSAVSLSVAGLPANVTSSFSPASVNGTGSSLLTLNAAPSAAPGSYSLTITGVSGSMTRTLALPLNVAAPAGCSLAVSPASVTLALASTASLRVSCTPQSNFNLPLNLSIAGAPSGVSVVLPSPLSTAAQGTITVGANASAAPGSYTVTLTAAASNGFHQSLAIPLVVQPASTIVVTATPANVSVTQGNSAKISITSQHSGAFNSAVNFTLAGLPSNVSATFSAATLAAPGDGTLQIALAVAAKAAVGVFKLTLTATGGGRTVAVPITLTVGAAPNFTIASDKSSLSIPQGGVAGQFVYKVTPLGGFNSPVTFSATGAPAGLTATFSPAVVSGSANAVLNVSCSATLARGSYPLTVSATGGTITDTVQITVTVTAAPGLTLTTDRPALSIQDGGSSAGANLTLIVTGQAGPVALSLAGSPAGVKAQLSPLIASSGVYHAVLNVSAPAGVTPGAYTLTVTAASGSISASVPIGLSITLAASFSLGADKTSLVIQPGGAPVTVQLSTQNVVGGFSAPLTFSASGVPQGVSVTFPAGSMPVSSGVTTASIAAAAGAKAGSFVLSITATGGGLSRTLPLTVTINVANTAVKHTQRIPTLPMPRAVRRPVFLIS